jgi:hypothetical protein
MCVTNSGGPRDRGAYVGQFADCGKSWNCGDGQGSMSGISKDLMTASHAPAECLLSSLLVNGCHCLGKNPSASWACSDESSLFLAVYYTITIQSHIVCYTRLGTELRRPKHGLMAYGLRSTVQSATRMGSHMLPIVRHFPCVDFHTNAMVGLGWSGCAAWPTRWRTLRVGDGARRAADHRPQR